MWADDEIEMKESEVLNSSDSGLSSDTDYSYIHDSNISLDNTSSSFFTDSFSPCINVTVFDLSLPYERYKIVVDVFIAGALCLTGFFGNALSIAVLCRDREKQNTTNWLLQSLALVDIVYLFACVLIQPIKTIHDMTNWWPFLKQVFPYLEPHIWGIASIAQTATVWLVLLVTVDRYVAVCMPLQNQWRSLARAKIAVVILLIVACLYNIPRFFEREYTFSVDCADGKTIVKTKKTLFRDNKLYFLVYKTIGYFIFRAMGPLITLIILNARLIRALQIVRKRHKDMNRRTKHRENITMMIVIVVTVFVVCELPDLGLRIAYTFNEDRPWLLNISAMRYANSITNTLLAVNSSSNFLIYCLVGKKFRRILVQMWSCKTGKYGGAGEVTETEMLGATQVGTGGGAHPVGGGVGLGGRLALQNRRNNREQMDVSNGDL